MFRFAILGLAAFGAYRLYELLQPRVADARDHATDQFQHVADTARTAADDVRDDLRTAGQQLKEDLAPPVEEARQAARESAERVTGSSSAVSSGSVPAQS
jgi:hypothetical protein